MSNDQPPDNAINWAHRAAGRSPCAKSNRGCAIFDCRSGDVVATGFNGQPEPFACDGSELCKLDCGKLCLHAEERALDAFNRVAAPCEDRTHFAMVHVKVDEVMTASKIKVAGVIVSGGPPSCWQCSRKIVESGIRGIWLYQHRDSIDMWGKSIWRFYSASDFHVATLKECRLYQPLKVS